MKSISYISFRTDCDIVWIRFVNRAYFRSVNALELTNAALFTCHRWNTAQRRIWRGKRWKDGLWSVSGFCCVCARVVDSTCICRLRSNQGLSFSTRVTAALIGGIVWTRYVATKQQERLCRWIRYRELSP